MALVNAFAGEVEERPGAYYTPADLAGFIGAVLGNPPYESAEPVNDDATLELSQVEVAAAIAAALGELRAAYPEGP